MINGVFRYADDVWVFYAAEIGDQKQEHREKITRRSQPRCLDLGFTGELPVNHSIKSLHLGLEFKEGHICWR